MIAAERHPLYNRVALPRYLRGQVREEKVLMRTVEDYAARNLEIHFETWATKVDPVRKVVTTDKAGDFPYDALLVATGGQPSPPPWPGATELPCIFGFQTLDDTNAIIAAADRAKRVLVMGGSFIAYELAEAFIHNGLTTYWVQRGPRFLRRVLDDAGGELVDTLAREAGVETIYTEEVDAVAPGTSAGGVDVKLKSGRVLSAGMLGYGLGLKMYAEWLEGSGIEFDGGIVCNEYLEASVPDVYTGGDIARFTDLMLDGQHNQMGTWDNAEEHGRVAARNMLGAHLPYREVPTYSTSMFRSNLAVMGITPENAEVESVTKVDLPGRFYRALFFYKNRIAGCVMIGSPKGRKKLIEMMQQGLEVPAGAAREALLDPVNLA
jgi:NAD(P)H-nitrite reductase large subunit